MNRTLSRTELGAYLMEMVHYYNHAFKLHWLAVDGGSTLDEFKRQCEKWQINLTEDDFYDLVYQPTWLTKEREAVLKMAVLVKKVPDLYELFLQTAYYEIVYHNCYLLPVINHVAGLIFDGGSPFDHPGIIARELQIPAIYYTKTATQQLQDGDEVELDGVHGQVIRL